MKDSKGELPPKFLLTVREAAAFLSIGTRTLWQLTHDGKIPCVQVGGEKRMAVRYSMDSLRKWVAEREVIRG